MARDKYVSTSELNNIMRDEIASLLTENNTADNEDWELPTDHRPYVILVVGVNGGIACSPLFTVTNRFEFES